MTLVEYCGKPLHAWQLTCPSKILLKLERGISIVLTGNQPTVSGIPKAPHLHGARQDRMFSRSVRNGQISTKKRQGLHPAFSGKTPR
jgi:hypothetical protein